MNKLIYIAAPEILAIPIVECYEPLIDIKQMQVIHYGSAPENEFTANDYTKVRKTVFEKLCRAEKDFPDGWLLRLYEGFRSLKVQQILFDQIYKQVIKRYPNADLNQLFHETTPLVSPVTNLDGTQNIPPHNTGAAVDIEVITKEGQLVDMGMTLKEWQQVDLEICMTSCKKINKTAQKNRQRLLEVMTYHGFINYPTEWWHYSYGDRYWAYHQPKKEAIYGSADLL